MGGRSGSNRRFVIVAFVLSASAVIVNAQASRTAPTEAQIKGEIVKQVGVEATVTFTREHQMFCTQCGKSNSDGARFCYACGSALSTDPPAPEGAALGTSTFPGIASGTAAIPQYAGFWIRFAASVIDSFVIGALAVGVAIVGGIILGFGGADFATAMVVVYYAAAILASWLYFALLESSERQATVGKRVMGVVVMDTSGHRISFGRATGRAFAKWLNALTLGIGWIMAGMSSTKQGLHDHVAGTVVVSHKRAPTGVVAVVVILVCAIPAIGIVAAVAIPGLLRARMSGNETSAIGSLRAINSAQATFATTCGNGFYAPTLRSLATAPSGGSGFISSDLDQDPSTKSGYTIALTAGDAVPNAVACNGSPVARTYFASAAPVTEGATGIRYFATNASNDIFQSTSKIPVTQAGAPASASVLR